MMIHLRSRVLETETALRSASDSSPPDAARAGRLRWRVANAPKASAETLAERPNLEADRCSLFCLNHSCWPSAHLRARLNSPGGTPPSLSRRATKVKTAAAPR